MILEIDWQGARQVRVARPRCQSIFILPPSLETLRERLNARQTDSEAAIARRLADARSEMSHFDEFDYIVVNDDFDHTLRQLQEIIAGRGEPFRSDRAGLEPILANLLA